MRCRRSRVWPDRSVRGAAAGLVWIAFFLFAPTVAEAACTWSFNWYCSSAGCTRNTGGRSTGTVPGFASEDACRAGIAQFRRQTPGIGVGSCSRQGQCDEGSAGRPGNSAPGRRVVPGGVEEPVYQPPAYDVEAERQRMEQEEEMRRQAEEADRQAKEQAERLAAERKFNQDKIDVLKGMKGVDFDGSGGVSGGAGDLGLKSSTPTLGIKANPGGDDLALKPTAPSDAERGPRFSKGSKDSAPVDLGLKSTSASPQLSPGPAPVSKQIAKISEVPPPATQREETFQEWLHKNWRTAPKHLRPLIQRALRDPEAMKELMSRRSTELGEWYRDATKESFVKKMAREITGQYAVSRAKILAWWDDPMHRQWFGDAAMIALAPFDAAAFKGVGRSVAGKPAFLDEVSAAYRWQHEARTSGAYYNFPTVYRGKQPNIPRWLFTENPYADPFAKVGAANNTWEGTRTAVWMNADDVWIKRTPEADNALRAADEEFFRAITGQGR